MENWNGKNWEEITYRKLAKIWCSHQTNWYGTDHKAITAIDIFAEYLDRKATRNKKLNRNPAQNITIKE